MTDLAEADRAARADAATRIQMNSSLRGFCSYAMLGMGLIALSSFYSPTIRAATPAAKAYGVLVVGTFGACIAQDTELINHISHQRTTGSHAKFRQKATDALYERGEFPTETKIYAEIERLQAMKPP